MAVTNVKLNDPIQTLVSKVNTISQGLGDIDNLTGGFTNVVAAIEGGFDSDEIVGIIVNRFNDSGDVSVTGSFTADSATFSILTTDSANITNLVMDSKSVSQLKPFGVYNSGGTAMFRGYMLSTSNTNSIL